MDEISFNSMIVIFPAFVQLLILLITILFFALDIITAGQKSTALEKFGSGCVLWYQDRCGSGTASVSLNFFLGFSEIGLQFLVEIECLLCRRVLK